MVAPHPDDEAIGALGFMAALRRRGARVWVLVVAEGGASHPGSRRWPPAGLVAERRRETRRAMAALGIPPARLRFLGLPEGALTEHAGLVAARCGCALRRMPWLDVIVGPVTDDAHPDHRTVAAALARGRFAPIHLGYRARPLGTTARSRLVIPLDAQTRTIKRRVVRSYRTQAGLISDPPIGMAIRSHHPRACAGPAERFEVMR